MIPTTKKKRTLCIVIEVLIITTMTFTFIIMSKYIKLTCVHLKKTALIKELSLQSIILKKISFMHRQNVHTYPWLIILLTLGYSSGNTYSSSMLNITHECSKSSIYI